MPRTKRKARPAIKPPPGWSDLGEIIPPPEPEKQSSQDQVRELIRRQVAAGFLSDRALVAFVVDSFDGELSKRETRSICAAELPKQRRLHAGRQKKWPGTTDCDRLDAAFADLEKRGILSRQNYWCCATCGSAAIVDEVAKERRRNKTIRGYCFFHEQDTDEAVQGNGLSLNYGAAGGERAACAEIGQEIMKTLRARGLSPRWDGDIGKPIAVSIDWKRRTAFLLK